MSDKLELQNTNIVSCKSAPDKTEEDVKSDCKKIHISKTVWTVEGDQKEDKVYSYEDAINLAGDGGYSMGLLACLSLIILGMGMDMFGFSVVVAGSSCDLQISHAHRSLLMSIPFLGAIIMSYPWGYCSDMLGRRRCLRLAMTVGFAAAALSVFSPHWIILAVLKFISTSCCSCAQSVTYALLGESTSVRVRGSYMLTMTGILMLTPASYFFTGYFILNLEFSYDLGFIRVEPWRLLVLVLALPMGISALALRFFHESPKFVANMGREEQAVELLSDIWRRNGGKGKYPVMKLVLNEDSNTRQGKSPFLQSLWEQTAPLFKLPLLLRTLQLYYLIVVMYATNNSFVMWYPFIANAFISGMSSSSADQAGGLCNMIISSQNVTSTEAEVCSPKLESLTVLSSVGHSVSFAIINVVMSRGAARMKLMMISLMLVSLLCGVAIIFTTNNAASFFLFVGFLASGLGIGIVFSYFIKLYPTSYRGMVACLAVMVARSSALAGINVLGAFIMNQCYICFYGFTALIFSGLVVSFFLPADKEKKTS